MEVRNLFGPARLQGVDHISLRFVGNGVAPVTTRCKELAAVISATEDLVSAMYGEMDEDEDGEIQVCLVSLEDKSLGLKFTALKMAIVVALWSDLAAIVNTGKFETLNPKARESLIEIVSFVRKKNCRAFLGHTRNDTLATFDSSITLPSELKFRGRSSLIGEVVRVGGDDPKVRLRLPSGGKPLTCETTEAIARELGHRLYEIVICKGTATWDYATGEILKFRIDEVGTFKKVTASKAFESLAAAMPSVVERLRVEGIQYAS